MPSKYTYVRVVLTLVFWTLAFYVAGQDRFVILEEKLNQLAKNYPGINEQVDLSMNNATIQEYVRTIGTINNLCLQKCPNRIRVFCIR